MTTHLVWFRQIYVCTIISHWLPPAAIRLHACWRISLAPRQWAAHNVSPRQAELINTQLNALQTRWRKRYSFIVP